MNIHNLDIIGKNISIKNDLFVAYSMSVYPDLGKQVIKFDYFTQTIEVLEYDLRYESTYSINLHILSEKRLREIQFQLAYK
jgi:hypothetical protein